MDLYLSKKYASLIKLLMGLYIIYHTIMMIKSGISIWDEWGGFSVSSEFSILIVNKIKSALFCIIFFWWIIVRIKEKK